MGHLFKVMLLVLGVISHGQAQILTVDDLEPEARDIATDDPCAADLGVASPSDNLSCEFVSPGGGTFCYFRSELCNNNSVCLTGSDEGANIAALDCTGLRAGTGFPVFECTSGENVLLSQLCDGNADCGAGDDETTPLCENKCRFPYYGGCPYTRQCLTSALDVGCPRCLGGFVENPNLPAGGECFPLINITLELGTYNTAEGDGSVEVCAVLDSGMIEVGQSITTLLETSPGTASTADFGELNPPATLTFTSTQSRDCANILIVDDNIIEAVEFFTVTLSSNNFQVNIINSNALVFITDNDEALFEFTQNTYIGSEGVASPPDIPFAIRLAAGSAVLSQPVTVTVTSGAGSAVANSDYFPVSTQITFPAGSGPLTSLGSALDPIDDLRVEGNENVQLTASITAGTGGFTPNGDTATVVIQDNDVLTIGFNPITYQVSEAMGQIDVCFEVEENNVLDVAGQAILNTQSDSAIASADFTPLTNEVVNLPIGTGLGSPQFCTTITILQDGVPENLESFLVLLTSNSPFVAVNPATSSATVNILGDRIIFAFSQINYNVNEGDGTAEVCIDLISGVLSANTPIEITPQIGTAGALDFTSAPQTVVFPLGSAPGERRCINIPLNDDTLVEVLESFSVSAGSNDPNVEFMPGGNVASVSITDNDIAQFRYTQPTYVVGESSGPAQPAIELVFGTLTFDIDVDVATVAGGSATAGLDYINIPTQRLTFPAGSSPNDQIPFNVQILPDVLVEGDETVNLMANSPSNFANVNPDSATLVIDDDDLLEIRLQQAQYQVFESNNQDICYEVVSGILSFDINQAVSLTTADGTAVAPDDYTAISVIDSLLDGTGSPGNTVFCQTLLIQDDNIAEGIEDLSAQLASLSPFVVVNQPNMATIMILDNDMVMFEFSEVTYNVDEASITAEVCIDQVTGVTSMAITITITTADGSAIAPGDYTATTLPVIFPSGSTPPAQRCINIPINDDTLVEFPESFSVSASTNDPNAAFTVGRDTATVNINDNDDALFEFGQNAFSGSESVASPPDIPFSVRLAAGSGTLTQPVTIQVLSVPGGSATANVDYDPVAVQLVFPAGSGPGASEADALDPINDNRVEGTETVPLQASIVAGIGMFVPGANMATVNILDDDVLMVGLQPGPYTVLEFNGGSVDVCFEVESGILDIPVSPAVRLFTQDVTATGNIDYTAVDTNINLLSGTGLPGQTVFCTPISAIDDNIAEGSETLSAVISSLNGQFIAVNPARSSASVEILDDDNIILEFEELVYDTTEGGLGMVMVCVNLVSGILSRSVEVNVQPKPSDPLLDSATAGDDYALFTAPLTFPSGATPGGALGRQCFNLQLFINDDILVEALESFRISLLTNDPSAQFTQGRDCATANIADNDQVTIVLVPPPGVGVPSYTTPENTPTGSQEICVMIQGAPAGILQRPVTVNLVSSDGPVGVNGAQSPADYGAINAPIIFNPGQEGQQMCREIPIFDDIICEGDELFNVALTSNDPGVNLNPPTSTGTVTIIDNDVATISADQLEYWVNEQDDLWITLHLDGQKGDGRECVVSVMTVDGTATDGQDYVGIAGNYVFNSTTFTHKVQLDIINDNRCEGDETLDVFLSTNSPDCTVATPQLTVTIHDDEIGMGDDPHFSIYLPSGEMLCYTVQGEHGFAFNLINNKQLIMNAKFVPDARREEVTWLGSMGIIIQNSNYGGSNDTRLRFEAQEKSLYINDKVVLSAKNVEKLTFSNGKMTISEAARAKGFHYPSLLIDLQDVEVSFTIKYTNQHLDMFWHSTGKKVTNSHGIIGQFFRKGVEVDTVRKILIMPDKEPVPVMRRPVWSFMERETPDDQLCWTAMNPGYQGEGLIDGTYLDYLVDDVMSTDFKFKQG